MQPRGWTPTPELMLQPGLGLTAKASHTLVLLCAEVSRRRVRTVTNSVKRIACKYIRAERQAIVKSGAYDPRAGAFRALYVV
jgi:hypothetical protein